MYNSPEKTERKKGVSFTMGPISIHQFNSFSKYGINAIRLFQFLLTKEGLEYGPDRTGKREHSFVRVDNDSLYKWFGVSQPKKWTILKKLSEDKLIEVQHKGRGKAPLVKILVPKLN